MGRGVDVADVFESLALVIEARGIADETGPIRAVVDVVAMRGVVGGGATDGAVMRPGGAEGMRVGGIDGEDNVVLPGFRAGGDVEVDADDVAGDVEEAAGCFLRDARPNCPRSIVRKACPSRFKTMLPLKQQLIVPRSSLTTTTTASVSSVMPKAARCREPRLASSTFVSGIGKKTPARAILRSRMSTAPS